MTKKELEDKAISIAIQTFFYEAKGKEVEIYNWLDNLGEEDTHGDYPHTQTSVPYRVKSSMRHIDYPDFWFAIETIRSNVETIFNEYIEELL